MKKILLMIGLLLMIVGCQDGGQVEEVVTVSPTKVVVVEGTLAATKVALVPTIETASATTAVVVTERPFIEETATSYPLRATPTIAPVAENQEHTVLLPFLSDQATATVAPPTNTATPLPTIPPTATPIQFPLYDGPPLRSEQIGVQVHLRGENLGILFYHLEQLNVGWVKVQISWKLYQPEVNRYDIGLWEELDRFVTEANQRGIEVLLGVSKAPDWSRSTTEMDGPPDDFAQFEQFMGYISNRYRGNVAAYELWNESNLKREWSGHTLSGADFVDLLAAGSRGVREGDPKALIISGGPAVTGINDRLVAIDDRVYLREMVAAGVGALVDGVGIHPYGWANPPGSTVDAPDPKVWGHNEHPSFFFLNSLQDYREILDGAGVNRPLWATEFGWGSFAGFGADPPSNASFMSQVDGWEQAVYLLDGLRIGQELTEGGALIIWNLNFAPLLGGAYPESGYSLLGIYGEERAVYRALEYGLND